ncbi:MAG: hybrid histidine kinase/response regulator HrmK [Fischerella sp.]|nr:hybrid histidine kinase/response regulator HrmK [Fischerella sp.]
MQQYSSLPEQNSQLDATQTVLTTIEQLRAELWLERSLSQLQNRLNECLVCLVNNQQTVATEADIFKTVVNELSSALNNSTVAIALVEPQQTVSKICFISSSPSRRSSSPLLKAIAKKGKKPRLRLQEEIDIQDLQFLEKQEPPQAWLLADHAGGVIGWLIVARTTIESSCELFKDICTQITSQFLARAAQQCAATITQLRRIQSLQQHCQNLENFNQELERTNQLKNQFLANTSHEIRTPLSSIIGFTHLLLAQGYDPSRERHQEYLNIIQSSGKHLLALINDILDLSKIEANQLEMHWEKVDLQTLCRNVLILVKEKAANKGLKLVLEIDCNVTTLIADSLRLKQMLLNLLFNALKFTNTGTIGLQVKSHNSWIHFTVWDTGTGISKEHQTELFQPYFQIANAVVSRYEGTGLGLAVTRKLAELHGGWVEVESELNCGSRFTIILPLRQAQEGEVGRTRDEELMVGRTSGGETSPSPHPPITPSPNILLVEDDLPNAQMMQTYLQKLGYQVNLVKNAAQMWKSLNKQKPAVILLDIQLPDENGLALVKKLREHKRYQTIPIIVQTAMAMKGDRETCLAAGVNDYIAKPIDLPVLGTLVSKYCKACI